MITDLVTKAKDKIHEKLGINFGYSGRYPDRRKYVLKDFTVVTKAVIYIAHVSNLQTFCVNPDLDDLEYSMVDKLYVQINPKSFHYSCGIPISNNIESAGVSSSLEPIYAPTFSPVNNDDLVDIPLTFDIYDEYMARSGGGSSLGGFAMGAVGSILNGVGDGELSLFNEKITALGALIKYANCEGIKVNNVEYTGGQPYLALFEWGDIQIFGFIQKLEMEYSVFSPDGHPLHAEGKLEIKPLYLPMVKLSNGNWHHWLQSKCGNI